MYLHGAKRAKAVTLVPLLEAEMDRVKELMSIVRDEGGVMDFKKENELKSKITEVRRDLQRLKHLINGYDVDLL